MGVIGCDEDEEEDDDVEAGTGSEDGGSTIDVVVICFGLLRLISTHTQGTQHQRQMVKTIT